MTAVLERPAKVDSPRELISGDLFDRLVARLAEDEQIDSRWRRASWSRRWIKCGLLGCPSLALMQLGERRAVMHRQL